MSRDNGSSDIERPGDVGEEEPIPVPPDDLPPAPIEEPPDGPNVPDESNPEPIGDPPSDEGRMIV